MGWEKRGNSKYYYRKRRNGSRVVSEYIGTGLPAYLSMELDREEKMEATYKREKLRAYKREALAIDQEVLNYTRAVNGVLRALLLMSGYHPHKGSWRRKRNE